jgi:hypothetical protein
MKNIVVDQMNKIHKIFIKPWIKYLKIHSHYINNYYYKENIINLSKSHKIFYNLVFVKLWH